ncbi:MAG: outer membrane beta-barrel domain-containing protein [Bacteriovorax sp.]|jgi:outer membrane beta-barrel protein
MKGLNFKNIAIHTMFLSTLAAVPAVSVSAEKDLYDFLWLDPDKKVYVLQNKVHKKEHTVYANLGMGLGLSSTFQDTSLYHGNVGYYLTEEWALEGLYTSYSNKDNEAFDNLKRLNGSIPFIRKTKSNYGVIAKWSPFYGKINTFNKIFYFDWSFGLGLGKLETESNAKSVGNPAQANVYTAESYTTVIGKTELTFHATKNVHIGLGLIMNTYKAPGPSINNQAGQDKIRNNLDSILSVGFSF